MGRERQWCESGRSGIMRSMALTCLVGLVVLVSLSGFAADTGQEGKPSLSLSSTEHDFGQVREGKILSHDFKVRNTGKAELQIIEVRPG
jgi:hypothetical protein